MSDVRRCVDVTGTSHRLLRSLCICSILLAEALVGRLDAVIEPSATHVRPLRSHWMQSDIEMSCVIDCSVQIFPELRYTGWSTSYTVRFLFASVLSAVCSLSRLWLGWGGGQVRSILLQLQSFFSPENFPCGQKDAPDIKVRPANPFHASGLVQHPLFSGCFFCTQRVRELAGKFECTRDRMTQCGLGEGCGHTLAKPLPQLPAGGPLLRTCSARSSAD